MKPRRDESLFKVGDRIKITSTNEKGIVKALYPTVKAGWHCLVAMDNKRRYPKTFTLRERQIEICDE